jgi:hypothetical protein
MEKHESIPADLDDLLADVEDWFDDFLSSTAGEDEPKNGRTRQLRARIAAVRS